MGKRLFVSCSVPVEAAVSVSEHGQVELGHSPLCRAMGLKSQAERGSSLDTIIHPRGKSGSEQDRTARLVK